MTECVEREREREKEKVQAGRGKMRDGVATGEASRVENTDAAMDRRLNAQIGKWSASLFIN